MSDDDLAWDDDSYEPVVAKTVLVTKLDEEEEEEQSQAKKPAAKSAPKKGADKKADGKSGGSSAGGPPAGDVDPLAEKLRLQRLQEAADFDAARAAFGGEAKNLDDLCPTTEDDFTEYGSVLYYKYLRTYEKNGNFKEALKAMLRQAANAMSTHELKEVESSLVALRNQKLKEERDAQQKAAKKTAAKAKPQLKGNIEGDLDDVRYSQEALDEYDFM